MTHIHFVRQVHSVYTPDELEHLLSERGMTDAKVVIRLLESTNIDVVLPSPYKKSH